MKPDVTCAVCSVSRVHGAGYERAEHMCSRGEPLGLRGLFFFLCAGDVMACTCGWNPAGGSKALPDGTIHEGRGTRQLHDVTGKVQHVRLIIAAQVRELRVAALDAHVNLKMI